jgi:hypothetical protein
MLIGFLFFFSLSLPDVFTEAFSSVLWLGQRVLWCGEKIRENYNYKITCVCEREKKREMNVCVQIFLTQAACHLLNSFHEREKDKHKTKLSGSCRGEFVRLESFLTSCAYTLVLTRFLLVKCRGTAHIESKKQKKKQSHFFTSSSFLEFI